MSESLQGEKPPKEELEILSQAFQTFNEATQQLQDSYDDLKERVKLLDLELAKKNEELEKNLAEKEEVKNYLNNIASNSAQKNINLKTLNSLIVFIPEFSEQLAISKILTDMD